MAYIPGCWNVFSSVHLPSLIPKINIRWINAFSGKILHFARASRSFGISLTFPSQRVSRNSCKIEMRWLQHVISYAAEQLLTFLGTEHKTAIRRVFFVNFHAGNFLRQQELPRRRCCHLYIYNNDINVLPMSSMLLMRNPFCLCTHIF